MVSSFRSTVIAWLSETLQGDIYVSAPSLTTTTPSTPIFPEVLDKFGEMPYVKQIDLLRSVDVDSPLGKIHIAATDNPFVAEERIFLSVDLPKDEIWQEMNEGSVIVSEPLANRLDLPMHGGSITLNTKQGPRQFPISGIYYDYASTQGTILMSLSVYQEMWDDSTITAAALRLAPDEDVDIVVEEIQNELSDLQSLTVRANKSLRDEVLAVFDRTFAITSALQLLSTIVAFIGVLSALLSLELERQRELGVLRSIGLTVRQLWGLLLLETGLMGGTAGLLAMPTGYILAIILVYIINKRSFGWTLQMSLKPEPFLEAFIVATIAALIAGIYPAFRIGRMAASQAIRSE
jgi:putative ABC transport system permease protein